MMPSFNYTAALEQISGESEKPMLCLLVADLEGSSPKKRTSTEVSWLAEYVQAFKTIDQVIENFKGDVVKFLGDAVFAVFEDTADALSAAVAVQRSMESAKMENIIDVDFRISLHTGSVIALPASEDSSTGSKGAPRDYLGTNVDIVFRLNSLIRPRGIIASRAAIEDARMPRLVKSLHLFKDGRTSMEDFALKGIGEPIEACEVLWSDPSPGFEKSADKRQDAIAITPFQATTFVGQVVDKSGMEVTVREAVNPALGEGAGQNIFKASHEEVVNFSSIMVGSEVVFARPMVTNTNQSAIQVVPTGMEMEGQVVSVAGTAYFIKMLAKDGKTFSRHDNLYSRKTRMAKVGDTVKIRVKANWDNTKARWQGQCDLID